MISAIPPPGKTVFRIVDGGVQLVRPIAFPRKLFTDTRQRISLAVANLRRLPTWAIRGWQGDGRRNRVESLFPPPHAQEESTPDRDLHPDCKTAPRTGAADRGKHSTLMGMAVPFLRTRAKPRTRAPAMTSTLPPTMQCRPGRRLASNQFGQTILETGPCRTS